MMSIPNDARLNRDRWIAGTILAAVIIPCWGWVVSMALDMYGPMTGCSAWMMTRSWDFTHQLLLFAMWAVMMIGMMLPSAAPAVFVYASAARTSVENGRALPRALAFAVGYGVVWIIFSLVVTASQLALTKTSLLTPMMELRSRWMAGGLALIAGAYQFTPRKRKCLLQCFSPVDHGGSFRSGLHNGLSCLGCCWALMLLLFIGGVMNLWWITALTLFVALEKLTTTHKQATCFPGALLMAAAVWILLYGTNR